MKHIILFLALALFAFACKTSDKNKTEKNMDTTQLTGTITKLDRMALPPNAEVYLRLDDVSRADAPSVMIAEKTFPTEGKQVPISFELPYDATKIDPRMRYNIMAQIRVDGATMYRTTRAYPVINNGETQNLELLLDRQ